MIDRERAYLISLYLNGRMRPEERAGFIERLASDPKLQKMLTAEELIRGTIRRDLEALPTGHPSTEARVMASLASLSSMTPPPGSGSGSAGVGAGKAGIGGTTGSGNLFFSGSTFFKGIIGATVGAGILVGGYVLLRQPELQPPGTPVPAMERSVDAPRPLAPPAPPTETTPESHTVQELAPPMATSRPASSPTTVSATASERTTSPSSLESPPQPSQTEMKSIDGQSLKSTPAEEPPSRTDTENMSKRPLPVIKKTEKIPILVQPPKKAPEP